MRLHPILSRLFCLMSAVLALGLLAHFSAAAQAQDVSSADLVSGPSIAQEIEKYANEARASQGAGSMECAEWLDAAALGHSEEMHRLGFFSHTSPVVEHATPRQRIELAGQNRPQQVAENIYQCEGVESRAVARKAVDAWLASPGHRKNLLNPVYTLQGVGVYNVGETYVITHAFARLTK